MAQIARWDPPVEPSKAEARILKRLTRTRKLFAFLRRHRHELFDEAFQDELASMYRATGAGISEKPPAMMCMALLLQAYTGTSDAEAVELTIMDARWGMVLDCRGVDDPPFGQGSLQRFRERLIEHEMDRRLLERTVELARETKEFDWKKLPKELTVGIDSRPLAGAGRVEDTVNLLGHAARKIVACAARVYGVPFETLCRRAGIPLLLSPSIKAGLDINWSDPEEKDAAIEKLVAQVETLSAWLIRQHEEATAPLTPYIHALMDVVQENIEHTPEGARIKRGVAKDRRISIEDGDMRHGRKNKNTPINGYKEHVAADLDADLILAAVVTPANLPEKEAAPPLKEDIERQDFQIDVLQIDRGYLGSPIVDEIEAAGGVVLSKPWPLQNKNGCFTKAAFHMDLRAKSITCPAGSTIPMRLGKDAEFDRETCAACELRPKCVSGTSGRGRVVKIREDEARHIRLRRQHRSKAGRKRLRKRSRIEHRLAHVARRKGPRARYRGARKNTFDLRRAAAIQNLETIQRRISAR